MGAQSLTGVNGLFKVPNAYIPEDGSSFLGASFFPSGTYELYDNGDEFNGMPTFINLSLYNRVEFMFRYTHQLGQEVSSETRYFPDRMFSLRVNALKEDDKFPSITLGVHDVSEALGGTTASPWFLATYLVSSKTFKASSVNFIPTIGYAFDFIDSPIPPVFNGMFGGLEVSWSGFPSLSLVGEYDSRSINIAVKAFILGHIHLSVGVLDMQDFSGFITYNFNLSNK